jgi:hypothetical protein
VVILAGSTQASAALGLLHFSKQAAKFAAIVLSMNKNSAKKKAAIEKSAAPAPVREITLKTHKFQVGQSVYFTSGTMGRPGASGSYRIVKQLPSEGDDYQYRIKSTGEAFERVAKESQLDRDR